MEIKIYWNNKDSEKLFNIVNLSLEELWLSDFIKLEKTTNEELKNELKITKEPALIIIEESIDFKDIIFEWMVPEENEIKSMLVSIIWWTEDSCAPSSCSSCWSASVCWV